MLADEIKELIARTFKHESWFQFETVDDAAFEVRLPGDRLPVVGFRDLTRELSAKTTVHGPGFRSVLLEGQYKGQRLTLRLRAEPAG